VRYSSTPGHTQGREGRGANTGKQWISYQPHRVFQQLPRPQGVQAVPAVRGVCGQISHQEVRFCFLNPAGTPFSTSINRALSR
jgi:hypothetical protein